MENSGIKDSLPFSPESPNNKGIQAELHGVITPPEFGNPCVPAIGLTNEKFDSSSFQRLKDHKPSGIIYGVGAGNIFAMVKGFSAESPPKGLIMVDVNPAVILAARIFVNGFKKHDNWRDFAVNVLFARDDKRKQLVEEVIGGSQGLIRQAMGQEEIERFNQGMDDVVNAYYRFMGGGDWFFDAPSEYGDDRLGNEFRPILVIAQNYSLFHRLADEGNMAVVYSDLFNLDLLKRIAELSGIKEENNVIYTSNIAEVSRPHSPLDRDSTSGEWQEWLSILNSRFKSLGVLNPNKPRKNVFVQAKPSWEKILTIRSTPPTFRRTDFEYQDHTPKP